VAKGGGRLSFPRLFMHVIHELEGAFARLVRSTHFPNGLVACKRGSRLVIGFKAPPRGKLHVFHSKLDISTHNAIHCTELAALSVVEANGAVKKRRLDFIDTANPREGRSREPFRPRRRI
jgi:glucosamine 6-phosphate synthetase-like amidotransferase/phosphosugar isomerase protein